MMPFFCFYGGKWRSAPHYPVPKHETIIEPFAGAAGYSTRYYQKKVFLCEKDPVIAGLWKYLIKVKASEILSLPDVVAHVDDIDACQEAKHLVGFWLNKGAAGPCKTPSAWARSGIRPNSYWGPEIKARIAQQVDQIRHWKVYHGSWEELPDAQATWFIDPPYQVAGRHYKCSQINYPALGTWTQQRQGQIIVCENAGADWLPFQPFMPAKATPGRKRAGVSNEVVWVRG